LIQSVSQRLTKTAAEIGQVQDGLQVQIDRAWQLQDSRNGVIQKNNKEFEKYSANTTASIYALRDNTQKAFSDVAKDIDAVKKLATQRNLQQEIDIAALKTQVKVLNDFRRFVVEMAKGLSIDLTSR